MVSSILFPISVILFYLTAASIVIYFIIDSIKEKIYGFTLIFILIFMMVLVLFSLNLKILGY